MYKRQLLGSIGLVNFSNIIITGIINRQREFATLESIGMTKKQINKLTVLELSLIHISMGLVLSMSGITIALFLVTKQTAVLLTGGALLLCALVGIFVVHLFDFVRKQKGENGSLCYHYGDVYKRQTHAGVAQTLWR